MKEYDIIIVGAGIVGLAHAYHAAERNQKVLVLEKNQFALGASIRNFGLVWPIGQPQGELLDRALRNRATWKKLNDASGNWYNENGSLHLAYYDDEMQVLEEFSKDAKSVGYEIELVSSEVISEKYPHINKIGLKGGLYSRTEMTVNPPQSIKTLASYLATKPTVHFHFGKAVTHIAAPIVETFDDQYMAGQIIVCSGSDMEILYPRQLQNSGLQKVKLQMIRTEPIASMDLGPSLCAGLTLRHYSSFKDCQSLKKVVTRYDLEMPEYSRRGVHLLVSQNNHGELVIGDSHEYGLDHYPFDSELTNELIFEYLDSFLDIPDLKIKERWHGIYSKMEGKTELILRPENNVTLVTGLSGAGMTLSFGLAEEIIGQLLGEKVDY